VNALLWALSAHAAEVDADAVWRQLAAAPHLRADFTQVQVRRLLKAPLVSTGTLAFERPDRLRWEVAGAAASVFVVRGDTVAARMPGVPQVTRVDLAQQPQLAGLVSGLTVWLAADAEALGRSYEVRFESDRVVALTPKDPALLRAVSKLTLQVAPSRDHVSSVELLEPDGDRTTITLSNVDLVSPLPATLFALD
jgi:outer membrane lipoprotein-sorting protein